MLKMYARCANWSLREVAVSASRSLRKAVRMVVSSVAGGLKGRGGVVCIVGDVVFKFEDAVEGGEGRIEDVECSERVKESNDAVKEVVDGELAQNFM